MLKHACLLPLLLGLTGCALGPQPTTVGRVDLARYSGIWYEIARLPQNFENGCTAVTATYTPLPNGTIKVLNRCHQGRPDGPVKDITGTARSTNPPANSKLKVMFFWPFEGDYWVFRLNDDYSTAAVGDPERHSLWILHRSPTMDESEYRQLTDSLRADGFPVNRLERTVQEPRP